MDDRITQHADIELRAPVLVAAFRGWNDAGDAASFAASHLGRVWSATNLASIDPEDFYDFQAVRPQVELVDGTTRKITWPANEFMAARLTGTTNDVIVLVGTEPSTKWRTFSNLVVEIAKAHGVKLMITLGALLADVPHSRPVQITGTAVDPELIKRLDLHRATKIYEERVTEMVAGDDDVQAYVRMLEERTDEQEDIEEMDPSRMPSGEDIAAE